MAIMTGLVGLVLVFVFPPVGLAVIGLAVVLAVLGGRPGQPGPSMPLALDAGPKLAIVMAVVVLAAVYLALFRP